MAAKIDPKRMMGPLPTLLVAAGACAEKVLRELSRMAQGLAVPIQGPVGVAVADSCGESVFSCDWPCVCGLDLPEPLLMRERSVSIGQDDNKLLSLLSVLVRRLRSVEPAADSAIPGRVRTGAYVMIDLSETGSVASAIRLMRVLRRVDAALDVTVLALTDRTAVTDCGCEDEWFGTWCRLLEQLEDEPFAQRVYLLDGCDADKVWFERPEQLHRLGAEFLLHHGFTCRSVLRQSERARTGLNESLLNVCGSFGCRTIAADLSAVAERVAQRLAREDLADLYKRPVPSGWLANIDEQAQRLVGKVEAVCESAYRARPVLSGRRWDDSETSLAANAEISEAMAKAIKQVCSREPLVSVCHFLKCLQPKLAALLTRQRLLERARSRQLVAEALRRQDEHTYEPMRVWLSDPQTRWMDRFTPEQEKVSDAVVSQPAAIKTYLAGAFVLVAGLLGIGVGLLSRSRFAVIAGGLVSLAASALMALPVGWVSYPRNRIREGQQTPTSVPAAEYRKRASWQSLCAAVTLIVVGLIGVTWLLWPAVWTPVTITWLLVLTVIAGIGVAFIVGCPAETHPDQVSREEAPGHVGPPEWRGRAMGLSCLGLAWIIFCLGVPLPVAPDTGGQLLVHFGGIVLVAIGAGLALFPWTGHAYPIERVAKMPQPLDGGIAHPSGPGDLGRETAALIAWIDRLVLDPDQYMQQPEAMDARRTGDTLFDFLGTDWDSQLAEAFRRALEIRSGKSLRTLALQPILWTECIIKELQNSRTACCDLASLFALQAVRAWVESYSLAELLSYVDMDRVRFVRRVGRLASPHWPAPRIEPDLNTCVIAVGQSLWEVLGPLDRIEAAPPIVPLDWDSRGDRIVVLRVAQGLARGWRGFPGLPGQLREQHRIVTVAPARVPGGGDRVTRAGAR